MCGIVGAVSSAPVDAKIIETMRDCLAHRGPDHAGIWLSDEGRIGLGHRRLAILDLTPEANQPFVSADGRLAVTFNGEIYNHATLREELVALGAAFCTRSDTEVLVEAYRCWGEQCLSRLSGMFAFAMWDCAARRLFCARDRAGEKPFHYGVIGNSFVFASELKALVLYPGFRREIHYPALIDYLSFGFVADPKSIWEGCYKLPAGHWMTVDLDSHGAPMVGKPIAYWDMEFDPDHSVEDWSVKILDTLQSAGKEMAFADVPVGTFLSGGVDSSSVTAALAKAGCAVNSFTVGFEEEDYDERPWARQVAQRYQTHHVERVVRADDVAPVLRKLVWHYDEPFNDYSYLPTFYVCREARKFITVALSGDGGDELFAGYRKYQRLRMREDVQRFMPQPIRATVAAGANTLLAETDPLRRKLGAHGIDAPRLLLEMLTTGFPIHTLRTMGRGALAGALQHYTPMDALVPLLRQAPPERVGLVNAMRYLDLKLTLAGDMLVKVDRASMAVSLEVRPVYLHQDMLALAGRIPPERLVDRHQSKKLLKSALMAWLPEPLLYRRKQGLAMPLGKWLNSDLRKLVAQNHQPSPVDDLLDSTLLEKMVEIHSAGKDDFASRIHSLFFLKEWFAEWV